MNLTDFSEGSLWAIAPEAMDQMLTGLPRAMRMDGVDQAVVKIRDLEEYSPELEVVDGVAIIPISGTIAKRLGFFSFFYGGASIDRIRADLGAAMSDARVRAIVLNVDSPGGQVNGVCELAETVFAAREEKPIVTFSDGQITSAATWIGSAANKKIISPTAQDGSIGVLTVHGDYSAANERSGVRYTWIAAGKYKCLGNEDEPLSDEALGIIQERLNETYDVFIAAMARYRSADEARVRQDMADGRVFVGRRAVEAGLADQLGSLRGSIDAAAALAAARNHLHFVNKGARTMDTKDITTVEQLRQELPQLCKAMTDQAAEAALAAVDLKTQATEAASQERDRILGLVRVHYGEGAGQKFAGIAQGGVTVEQYTAMRDALGSGQTAQGQDADESFRRQMLAGVGGASAPDPGAGGGDSSGPSTWDEAVSGIQRETKCGKGSAIRQAAAQYPDLHDAYVMAQAPVRKR